MQTLIRYLHTCNTAASKARNQFIFCSALFSHRMKSPSLWRHIIISLQRLTEYSVVQISFTTMWNENRSVHNTKLGLIFD